jgi:hypothetical protein
MSSVNGLVEYCAVFCVLPVQEKVSDQIVLDLSKASKFYR